MIKVCTKFYLFPKGMSVMMMSAELVLMGRRHRSHCAVSIDKPGEALNEKINQKCEHHVF